MLAVLGELVLKSDEHREEERKNMHGFVLHMMAASVCPDVNPPVYCSMEAIALVVAHYCLFPAVLGIHRRLWTAERHKALVSYGPTLRPVNEIPASHCLRNFGGRLQLDMRPDCSAPEDDTLPFEYYLLSKTSQLGEPPLGMRAIRTSS
jgi:hypothetical protein